MSIHWSNYWSIHSLSKKYIKHLKDLDSVGQQSSLRTCILTKAKQFCGPQITLGSYDHFLQVKEKKISLAGCYTILGFPSS